VNSLGNPSLTQTTYKSFNEALSILSTVPAFHFPVGSSKISTFIPSKTLSNSAVDSSLSLVNVRDFPEGFPSLALELTPFLFS